MGEMTEEEIRRRLERYRVPFLGNQSFAVFNAIETCARLADMGKTELEPDPAHGLFITVIYRFLYPLRREGWERVVRECEFLVNLYEQAPSFRELLLRIIRSQKFKKVMEFLFKLCEYKEALEKGDHKKMWKLSQEVENISEWMPVL